MSDYYSIQEVGGKELAQHYPDRGLISEAEYHKAILCASTKAEGWRRIFRKSERFIAVLSADREGLRIFVSLDDFAIFIPWSEVTVSAERAVHATVVRLQTAPVPSIDLEFHLDDASADVLFRGVVPPLAQRHPPARLFWPKPWVVWAFMLSAIVTGIISWQHFSGTALFVANVVTATGLALLWIVGRPIFEADR